MLKQLETARILIEESDAPKYRDKKPSEIEMAILDYNKYTETLNDLYAKTDEYSRKVPANDINEVINYNLRLKFDLQNQEMGKPKEADPQIQEKQINLASTFKNYKEEMCAIDENGRSKSSAIKAFFEHMVEFVKEKALVKDVVGRGISKNHGIAEEYVGGNTQSIPIASLSIFRDCLEEVNKAQFLIIIYQLNQNIENLKQLRDRKMAAQTTGHNDVNGTDENSHVYSYGDGESFVSADNIGSAITETENVISGKYDPKSMPKNKADKKAVKEEIKSKKKANEEKRQHLLHIQAEDELSNKFDEKRVGELLNGRIVLAYLSFDPSQYEKSLMNATAESAKEASNTRGKANQIAAGGDINARMYNQISAERPTSIGGKIQYFLDKISPFLNLIGSIGSAISPKFAEANEIASQILDGLDQIQNIASFTDTDQKDEAKSSDIYEKLKDICDKIDKVINIVETLSESAETSIETIFKLGKMSAKGVEKAGNVLGFIGGATNVASGLVDFTKGAINTGQAIKSMKTAKTSMRELEQLSAGGADTAQASRLVGRAEIIAQQNAAEGVLDMVTGGIQVAGAVSSMIPGGEAVGTGLGILASAVSFFGKIAISRYFKGKVTDSTWAGVLGYSKGGYEDLISRMGGTHFGGRADERFHNVLRRKTGLSTRTDYANALLVTDAIDLYTAARAYPIINGGGQAPPIDTKQQVIKTTLSGMQIKPSEYGSVELDTILDNLKLDTDWRGTLKKAITNNSVYNIKEDLSTDRAEAVMNGKYDPKEEAI